MDYLPTLGEKWPHSRGNVGKYSLHGSFGIGMLKRQGEKLLGSRNAMGCDCLIYFFMP